MAEHIIKGNGKTFTFTIKNCDGTPLDLTDVSSIVFLAKKNVEDADADAILTKTITTPTSNIVSFAFTSTETLALDEGKLYSGLKIYRSSDMDEQIWSGEILVEKGVFSV